MSNSSVNFTINKNIRKYLVVDMELREAFLSTRLTAHIWMQANGISIGFQK